ncbi:hypothetical protein GA0061098_1008121 [Bradyrhizobium shewense]|uniref:Uncharacterized protein n=1 Tax=Bradyrhizobium shewense TaxID=1761772 RepID=A0A1C3WJV4_9BRAD|nr:hypothetical protein GA0061098_1008121 [Bradyrhizobium shewense]
MPGKAASVKAQGLKAQGLKAPGLIRIKLSHRPDGSEREIVTSLGLAPRAISNATAAR